VYSTRQGYATNQKPHNLFPSHSNPDYRGNYDTFVQLRDANIRNAMRLYHAYQEKREHMMEFINKFRANAKRASIVQSRIKAVEKMDAEAPEAVEIDPVWRFSIPNSEPLGRPIISVDDVDFDYTPENKKPEEYLLQKVNFGVDLDSKIAILGANGQGALLYRQCCVLSGIELYYFTPSISEANQRVPPCIF